MPDKKLLIGLGVALLILGVSITYRLLSEDEPQQFSQQLPPVEIVVPVQEEEKGDDVMVLFNEMESNFHNLVEKVFLMGDDAVSSLEDQLYEIEGLISEVKKEAESGSSSNQEVYVKLINIQEKIILLSQKIVELEG